jgi:hypothetical protein
VSQARKEEEEICMQNRDNFYIQILGSKEGQRDGKRTNHGILEGNHCLDVFLC